MALGRWRFGSGKSRKQSSSSSGDNDTTGSTTPNGSDSHDLAKTQSRLSRLAEGFRAHRARKSEERGELAHLHKPFTKQNLEHQKILNAFEWSMAQRRSSRGCRSIVSGISPNASRRPSIDLDYGLPPSTQPHPRFSNALTHDAPQEASGEESDKEQMYRSGHDFPEVTQVERV